MSVGRHIALAVAAGALATKKEPGAALQDRFKELKRAISKKSDKIRWSDVAEDPSSEEHRAALAKDLDEHGAATNRHVVASAKELLGLIKLDDAARTAVEAMIADIEKALVELADAEVDDFSSSKQKVAPKADPEKPKADAAPKPKPQQGGRDAPRTPQPAESERSRRSIPMDEPSKTELERLALPIHKRTDRFFLKVGIVAVSYIAIALVYWFVLRTPPNEALERCRHDDPRGCWLVVASEDSLQDEQKMSIEPLQLLCEHHLDPCGCAGLAYVNAVHEKGVVECTPLKTASDLDPKWPCACARYNFWKQGQQRTAHCGVPKCE